VLDLLGDDVRRRVVDMLLELEVVPALDLQNIG
jgi:hypothetical protein